MHVKYHTHTHTHIVTMMIITIVINDIFTNTHNQWVRETLLVVYIKSIIYIVNNRYTIYIYTILPINYIF